MKKIVCLLVFMGLMLAAAWSHHTGGGQSCGGGSHHWRAGGGGTGEGEGEDYLCTLPCAFRSDLLSVSYDEEICATNVDYGQIHVDLNEKFIRLDVFVYNNEDIEGSGHDSGKFSILSIYQDFKKREQYVYSRLSDTCSKMGLVSQLPTGDMGIPSNASFLGDKTIGKELFSQYWIKKEAAENEGPFSAVVVVNEDCWPAKMLLYEKKGRMDVKLMLKQDFSNFVPMSVPMFYDLPSRCEKATTAREEDIELVSSLRFNVEPFIKAFSP